MADDDVLQGYAIENIVLASRSPPEELFPGFGQYIQRAVTNDHCIGIVSALQELFGAADRGVLHQDIVAHPGIVINREDTIVSDAVDHTIGDCEFIEYSFPVFQAHDPSHGADIAGFKGNFAHGSVDIDIEYIAVIKSIFAIVEGNVFKYNGSRSGASRQLQGHWNGIPAICRWHSLLPLPGSDCRFSRDPGE